MPFIKYTGTAHRQIKGGITQLPVAPADNKMKNTKKYGTATAVTLQRVRALRHEQQIKTGKVSAYAFLFGTVTLILAIVANIVF